MHKKFSAKFATEVQWQKVDANGNEVSDDEEDITQGNDGPTPDPNEETPVTPGGGDDPNQGND